VKKLVIYKFMGSNLFINHSLKIMNVCYKVFGLRITNFLIDSTVGPLFISGQSLQQLIEDVDRFKQQNIKSMCNYVAEGLETMDSKEYEKFCNEVKQSIRVLSQHTKGAFVQIKPTALMPIDAMTSLSSAQKVYVNDVLKYSEKEFIDIEDIKISLN